MCSGDGGTVPRCGRLPIPPGFSQRPDAQLSSAPGLYAQCCHPRRRGLRVSTSSGTAFASSSQLSLDTWVQLLRNYLKLDVVDECLYDGSWLLITDAEKGYRFF